MREGGREGGRKGEGGREGGWGEGERERERERKRERKGLPTNSAGESRPGHHGQPAMDQAIRQEGPISISGQTP